MSGPHMYIRLQVGCYPSDGDVSVAIPIDELAAGEAFVKLDEYEGPVGRDMDAMDRLVEIIFCTPAAVVARVKRDRRELINQALNMLLDEIAKHDTTNGYKREVSQP